MGIPSYFSWLVRHFEQKIITDDLPFDIVNQFYLDFNCAIHPVSRSHPEYSIDQMCDQVVTYLQYLINYVHPKDLIYIAIDGVAPVAKIKQQRVRRYKSIKETADMNQLKRQFGIPIPTKVTDYNMISPGTEYMAVLSSKINIYLETIRDHYPQIIFSDSSVPSEGEHKILQHIKTQPINHNCVIYGLDSDLIMLSLSTQRDNVILIRESTLIRNNHVDIEINQYPKLNYFLVPELKKLLFSILVTDTALTGNLEVHLGDQSIYDPNSVIRDYIFMSFLLGNDFLPAFPTLKIREHGIEKLIGAYRQILTHNHNYLCLDNLTINKPLLIQLIQILALNEQDSLYQQKAARDRKRYLSTPKPNTYAEAVEQYQKIEHSSEDPINVHRTGWQDRYYNYFFQISHRQPIAQICHDYWMGLQWNMRYYFDQCADWYWFYHHEATPLLSDFVQHIESFTDCTWIPDPPIKPYHQLMMILPPQSANLLPTPYHCTCYLMTHH